MENLQKIIDVNDLKAIIKAEGLENILAEMINRLDKDFARWDDFNIIPRPAFHVDGGVIELMPICDGKYFTFKCVNGHPANPSQGKQCVIATGQINRAKDGYPTMISEMTIVTAIRTAAMSALASQYMAKKDAHVLSLIGTGAQSEFQLVAHTINYNLTEVRYFDIDFQAMDKFEKNMKSKYPHIIFSRCLDQEDAVRGADIINVCTACKGKVLVIKDQWVRAGMHINGLGGDCPGKTELDPETLKRADKVIVEYFDQAFIEGEIQAFDEVKARQIVTAEMGEVSKKQKSIRENNEQITIFDSVGIALEDFTMLLYLEELANKHNLGQNIAMIPQISDPKDLYSAF